MIIIILYHLLYIAVYDEINKRTTLRNAYVQFH